MSTRLRAFCAVTLFALAAACARADEPPEPRPFNPGLAWAHVGEQLAFGPRVAGLPPHERQLRWMKDQLGFRADTVMVQQFTGRVGGKTVKFANVFARWRPEAPERVLLVAHWDSPRHATRDPEEHLRRRPVPGANEGASGVAVLMELAQLFHEVPPAVGVDILLTDGLEGGAGGAGMGARHFLANRPPGYRPRWAVYVDRVGDRDLRIPMEGASARAAPGVVRRVWEVARSVGMDSVFLARTGEPLAGEHQLLAAGGIPTAAVIDPEHGRQNELWRTTDDAIDQVRRESLGAVGTVLSALVYRERP
ncbi:MAG TPA: M28 family peptidase [Longimicrobium sp.]|nr:M28 family peptidase [Longimicrobium sp.]